MNLIYRSNKLYVVKTLPEEPNYNGHGYYGNSRALEKDHDRYVSALSNPENLLEVGNQNAAKEDIMIHHNMPVLVEDVIYSLPDDQFLSKVTGCGGGCKNFNDAESLLLCHDHGCQHKVAIISEVTPKLSTDQIKEREDAINWYRNPAALETHKEENNLLDLQYNLRNLLFVRPYDLNKIESAAVKLCDAIVNRGNDIEK